jgi:segregation and condensation protein A
MEGPAAAPETEPDAGSAVGPVLALEGYSGPLDRLLMLARAQQIDLARLPLGAFVSQLVAALEQAPPAIPLSQKGDWVVMGSWLLQLRSLLLLPAGSPDQQAAETEAAQLRDRLVELRAMQGLAAWLDRRPQLGRDVFARGQPEIAEPSVHGGPAVDVIEFLWASLALFDDDQAPEETASRYRPRRLDLHSVQDARARIRRRLAEQPKRHRLERLLPEDPPAAVSDARAALRRRSAWSSTFVASLELAKQGEAVLEQGDFLGPIQVGPPVRPRT